MESSDGVLLGTVRDVLENEREHIFDGIAIETGAGRRWVDAPEIARITNARVILTLDAQAAAALPESDDKGAPEYAANAAGARRRFGRMWRRR